MKAATIIFPHQLFEHHPALKRGCNVWLVEEFLFFKQYRFHKRKIAFHRASMKFYKSYLEQKGISVEYIDAQNESSDIRILITHLKTLGITELHLSSPHDDWLNKRIRETAANKGIKIFVYDSPMFLNTKDDFKTYFREKENLRQTDFYIKQRKVRNVLIDAHKKPVGGKWSFDSENRLKYPKDKRSPQVTFPKQNLFSSEAIAYTKKHFTDNPGHLDSSINYPTTFAESSAWLNQFLEKRFYHFGHYEDAMQEAELILNHSLLSPLLNSGLLTPQETLEKTLHFATNNAIALNSVEGFVRQLIGWREFIYGIYEFKGAYQRTANFWNFTNKIPAAFYDGSTGIEPLDDIIKKVLASGYCHHIERLMVLGNFMLLCEFDPDQIYLWFMELFIDAYDWVMVPNVYGMSQFADGGLMATKPYISGSNYLLKMSNFKKGPWQKIWDGLFWRFMHVHRDFFQKNPRLGMLVKSFDKMSEEKQKSHLNNAEQFLIKIRI